MEKPHKPNVSGWLMLAVGLSLLLVGSFVLWQSWDLAPGSPGTNGLLFPLVLGIMFAGVGVYSLIKKKPITDDGSVRYPYMFKNKERADAHNAAVHPADRDPGEPHRFFPRRPPRPTAIMTVGLVFLLVGAVAVPHAIGDPLAATGRGVPLYLLPPALIVPGAYFIALGSVWRRRDRGTSSSSSHS